MVRSKINHNTITVSIPEYGYRLHYKLVHNTSVDTINEYPDGLPDFNTEAWIEFVKVEKLDNVKSVKDIATALRKESIIPSDLQYNHALVGFVYSTSDNPNNFRWWLDFRNDKDQSVFNYYGDKIEILCPISTKAWHDEDPSGIWHGRMVLSHNDLKAILEPKLGELKLIGKAKVKSKPSVLQNVPPGTEYLRLRYNIREDIWFCDLLDKSDKELGIIPCKNVICDARMSGQILGGSKPKVSMRLEVKDILEITIAINSLIIRGK